MRTLLEDNVVSVQYSLTKACAFHLSGGLVGGHQSHEFYRVSGGHDALMHFRCRRDSTDSIAQTTMQAYIAVAVPVLLDFFRRATSINKQHQSHFRADR